MVAAGRPAVVRLRMPDEAIELDDLVRGHVSVPPEALDDFILLRSDGSPTYHLTVVVDDVDMGITCVLRGDDHLSNTPKHVALFRAFGAGPPRFGHLPLILGADRKRLSKRTGAASVEEFRDQGILPQALYNYLALLGWSPGDDVELMSRDEMIGRFTVERLNASAAVFDQDKLLWMNGQYMIGLPPDELMPHLAPFLARHGLGATHEVATHRQRLALAVELHRMRARTLDELAAQVVVYFEERLDYAEDECATFIDQPELPERLEALRDRLTQVEPFEHDPLDAELRRLADELGVKAAALIHPLRMALSATTKGPSVFDLVRAQGREATRRHLANFVDWLRARQGAHRGAQRVP